MTSLLLQLKGLINILNVLLFLLIASCIFYRLHKRFFARTLLITALVLFLAVSTNYLPHYLAARLEKKYSPLKDVAVTDSKGKLYILVLGSGCSDDKDLPATAQLGLIALGRLAEGIRLYRLADSAAIICSGHSMRPGIETQASVTKRAAISLGMSAKDIITLNTPSTTIEEAEALALIIQKNAHVLLVTDAVHMPRAVNIFNKAGFTNLEAAPTNFKAKDKTQDNLRWWPAAGNLDLFDRVMHEYLGSLKKVL